jgi:hypothetical protein
MSIGPRAIARRSVDSNCTIKCPMHQSQLGCFNHTHVTPAIATRISRQPELLAGRGQRAERRREGSRQWASRTPSYLPSAHCLLPTSSCHVSVITHHFFASPLNTSSIVVVKVPKGLASILGCWMEPLMVILKSSWRAPCQMSLKKGILNPPGLSVVKVI